MKRDAEKFSLRSLILSRLDDCRAHADGEQVEVAMRLHEVAARQAHPSTEAAGVWVPFAALSRDLLTTNANGLVSPVKTAVTASLGPIPSVIGSGATILTGLNGATVPVPTFDTGIDASSAWLAENSPAVQGNPAFGLRTISPRTIAVEMPVSRRLLLQTNESFEAELRRELLKRVLNEIDRCVIAGDGALQPLGLLNDSAVEVLAVGANGGAPTWAHVVELESAVGGRSGQLAAPGYVMHPTLRKKLRTTQRAATLDFIMPGSTLLDQPVHTSGLLPVNLAKGTGTGLTPLIFGDLAEIVVGFWGPLAIDLMVDPYSRSTTGAVRLIARVEVGTVVRRVGALSMYKDMNPV
ncbi:MAG: phage major capsid protein [Leptothrix sp. (in: b-proteobacteria)]